MPNMCCTEYRFRGEKENISKMAEDIRRVQEDVSRNQFDREMIYHLAVDLLGMDEKELLSTSKLHVRGEFYLEWATEEEIKMTTTTAWVPCERLFELLAEKYDVQCFWLAEEHSCYGVRSNDTDYEIWDYDYFIYSSEGDEEYASSLDAVKVCNELLISNGLQPVKHLSQVYQRCKESELYIDIVDIIRE